MAKSSIHQRRADYRIGIVVIAIAMASVFMISYLLQSGSSSESFSSSQTSQSIQSSTGSSVVSSSTVVKVTSNSSSPSTSSTTSTSTPSTSSTNSTSTASSSTTSISLANDWVTYHGNNRRDGYDTSLPNVTSPSVSWKSFVDGPVYAEPLYFLGSVFVATENDTVYALSASSGAIQWSQHLGTPVDTSKPPYECEGQMPNLNPLGITGTPAIDPGTGTIYLVAMINGSGYRLFALNVNNGQLRWTLPVAPTGLDYTAEEERGALAVANGLVYVPFGGFSWDCRAPRGWVGAYPLDGNGTQYDYQVPATGGGDIWAPPGVSVDSSGSVYVVTGESNSSGPPFDYGNAVIKLTSHLSLVSYFAPSSWAALNANDTDLGSTGATVLPGNVVFSIGKQGIGYLLDASNLGGIGGQIFSSQVCGSGGSYGATAFTESVIYVPCTDGLYALQVQTGAQPRFMPLWNHTDYFAGPPIIAAGAIWTFDIYNGTLHALNPANGASMFRISLGSVGFVEHFTTPSVGGGLLLFAAHETIYALKLTP